MREQATAAGARVAVIGAGAAGLSAAKHLLARGVAVTVFEGGSTVGGLWVYENDSGRSPAYASLHINSAANVTHYPDFPFPDGTPLFPSHRQVHEYLEAYADHFDVRRHIRFKTWVTSVEPSDDPARGQWRVCLSDGSQDVYDAVVVATGHQASPAHPSFAADFDGEYLHSHSYRVPEAFAGKRVLVVGVGNSGLDIAADVCTSAARTVVSVRSPVLIMPRTIFGVPTSQVLGKVSRLPWVVQRAARRMVTRFVHGRMERFGLVTPKKRTHPASHPTFMSHVVYGRIQIRPGIERVAGTTVWFTDGSSEEVDTMIAATGYEIDVPFLPQDISPVEGRTVNLYKRVVHPSHPGLYFVGFFDVSGGANIRMMDVQANWVAALVTGACGLPDHDAMLRDIERERRRHAKLYPGTPRYGLELEPRPYVREVTRELQRPPGATRVSARGVDEERVASHRAS